MFNRRLAEFCSVAPQRLLGVAAITCWHVEAGRRRCPLWVYQPIAGAQIAEAAETLHSPPTRTIVSTTRFWSTFSPVMLTLRRYWLR